MHSYFGDNHIKYLYMSLLQRHIKSQTSIYYEEPYAFTKPTTTTFISTKTMETDEEKEGVWQKSQVIHA